METMAKQYAMAERVRALGWQQVEIINNDLVLPYLLFAGLPKVDDRPASQMLRFDFGIVQELCRAGLAAAQREGFERVLSSVALGEAPGQAHRRDKLASMLWSDRSEDAARQNLRQCLSA